MQTTSSLVLGWPAIVIGQETPDTTFGQLRPGQFLRLRLDDGRRVEARLLGIEPDPLRLLISDGEGYVPAVMVDSLWVRGRATKTGPLLVGAALGVSFYLVLGQACPEVEYLQCLGEPILLGVGLAAIGVGALLGAAMGNTISKWRLTYARSNLGFGTGPAGVGATVRIAF